MDTLLILKLRSEITDVDVLENICENNVAVLIDDENIWWIEILDTGEFFVNNGWQGLTTSHIEEAVKFLNKFIEENK